MVWYSISRHFTRIYYVAVPVYYVAVPVYYVAVSVTSI